MLYIRTIFERPDFMRLFLRKSPIGAGLTNTTYIINLIVDNSDFMWPFWRSMILKQLDLVK